jgi:hypothetical protein
MKRLIRPKKGAATPPRKFLSTKATHSTSRFWRNWIIGYSTCVLKYHARRNQYVTGRPAAAGETVARGRAGGGGIRQHCTASCPSTRLWLGGPKTRDDLLSTLDRSKQKSREEVKHRNNQRPAPAPGLHRASVRIRDNMGDCLERQAELANPGRKYWIEQLLLAEINAHHRKCRALRCRLLQG